MANTKKMTPKMFLYRSGTRAAASAIGFIAAYRDWLETGTVAEVTSPILRLIDEKQVMPTPGLELLRQAILTHMLRVEAQKAERQLAQGPEGESRPRKPWISHIYNKKGELCQAKNAKGEMVDLEETFQLASDADRWTDRKLFDGEPDWFGVVQHTTLMREDGEPITTLVMRQDAIARILKQPKGPVTKKTSGSNTKLGFGVKAHESRAQFSHG